MAKAHETAIDRAPVHNFPLIDRTGLDGLFGGLAAIIPLADLPPAQALAAVLGRPLLHPIDFSFLRGGHCFGQLADLCILAVFQHDLRHVDRALIGDHPASG